MPDLSSFTLGTSSIALGDFIVGYEAAAGSGSERRWTADDLTTGLLALAGATPAEVALLSGATSNIQAQINAASGGLSTHEARTDNPHTVTATQVGLGNVDNTSDADKPVSTLQATAIGVVQADIDAHELLTNNPHTVTAAHVGLGNVDNTSDADKPVSTLQAAAIATAQAWEDILNAGGVLLNVAVGDGSLSDTLLTGVRNSAMGSSALAANTTGSYNSAMGYAALAANTTGSYNSAMGYAALAANTEGNYNNAMGYQALRATNTGSGNNAIGHNALFSNIDGNYNNAIGSSALASNTTGGYNSAMGHAALASNTTGNYNNAMGYQALVNNDTGSGNNAIGHNALFSDIDGHHNNAIGSSALFNNVSGSHSVALGYNALLNSNATGNVGIGGSSGSGITSGTYNLAAGYQTLLNANGSYNIALGYQSARYQSGGTSDLTSADDSIFIGKSTKGVESATNQIVIGDSAEGLGSNTTVIGSAATTLTKLHGDLDTGGVLAGSGSASAPSYSFSEDSADGIYRAGASSIAVAVGGAKRHEFWSDGSLYMSGSGAVLRIEDTYLARDAAGTLAQRDGVNGQAYNIYNTYTSGSHYERAKIGWDADTFVIGTEAAGAGVVRGLSLGSSGGSVSLYGATPTAQAAHIADATDATDVITRVNAILVALENIGITASV